MDFKFKYFSKNYLEIQNLFSSERKVLDTFSSGKTP